MSLCSLTLFKTLLGPAAPADDSEDASLQALLDAASSAVEAYCQRRFASASYVEYYNGSGQYRLALRNRPVTVVSEVKLDQGGYFGKASGGFAAATVLVEGVDFVPDYDEGSTSSRSGVLFRIGGVWPALDSYRAPRAVSASGRPSLGTVKVTYTAGYATVPGDVAYAVGLLASHMRRTFATGGLSPMRERLGSYSYALGELHADRPELGTVNSTLAPYREIGW